MSHRLPVAVGEIAEIVSTDMALTISTMEIAARLHLYQMPWKISGLFSFSEEAITVDVGKEVVDLQMYKQYRFCDDPVFALWMSERGVNVASWGTLGNETTMDDNASSKRNISWLTSWLASFSRRSSEAERMNVFVIK